jgi:protein TonB
LLAAQNPLDRVLELESGRMRTGFVIGLCGALLVHVAAASEAARVAAGMGNWALDLRTSVHAYLAKIYEVDLVEPPPPPPPPPEPEPEKEAPKPVAVERTAAPQKDQPPPPPAQAGKILTQEPTPDEPVDLTGQGFVTGNADTYAGGVTANNGTSTMAVRNLNAALGGVQGGTGTKPGPTAVTGPDLSHPPSLSGGTDWDCPFPAEADSDQIDFQRVQIVVTVRADGSPQDVKVVGDPGHGFGRAARQCAMRRRFNPGTDHQGNSITSTMPPINVTFKR